MRSARREAGRFVFRQPARLREARLRPEPRVGRRERLIRRLLDGVKSNHSNRGQNDGREARNEKRFHGNHSSPIRPLYNDE